MTTTYLIDLDRIQDNPWQPRQAMDEDSIQELADSIRENGLLQPPLVRIAGRHGKPLPDGWLPPVPPGSDITAALNAAGGVAQLAFGHRRTAAFRHLAIPFKQFRSMPVQLAALSDEQMAKMAWAENAQRKDLNAIEEALLIVKLEQDFGWTDAQIAEHLGMSRPWVSNRRALLDLPADVQELVRTKAISDRKAMALKPLFKLPQTVLDRAEAKGHGGYASPSYIVKHAATLSSDDIRQFVQQVARVGTEPLDTRAKFPLDHAFESEEVCSPTCTTCPVRVTVGEEVRCGNAACYALKGTVWATMQAQAASESLGLPIFTGPFNYSTTDYLYPLDGRDAIVAAGCPNENLHVYYSGNSYGSLEGFPNVQVVCCKGQGKRCTCKAAQSKATSQVNQAQEREQVKAVKETVLKPTVTLVARGLARDVAADATFAEALLRDYCALRQIQVPEQATLGELYRLAAEAFIVPRQSYQAQRDPEQARREINALFANHGLSVAFPETEVDEIRRKLERTVNWVEGLAKQQSHVQAVGGTIKELAQLRARVEALELPDTPDMIAAIDKAAATLERLLPVVEEGAIGSDDFDHISWLLNVPPGDVNFQLRLKEASAQVLRYALAVMPDEDGHQTRRLTIERRLRKLERDEAAPEPEAAPVAVAV